MQPQVSILLLNYNGKKFNQACIASILTQTYQYFEILFIDNVSTDGSGEEVERLFSKEIKSKKIKK
jgi:glycosyltransferase involved in cell wall biosynthesis